MQDALRSFLKESGLGPRMRHWPVYKAWNAALGKQLAQRARPVRFAKGELLVEVESATHLHELANFTGDEYRKRANAALGGDEIRKVVFKLKR